MAHVPTKIQTIDQLCEKGLGGLVTLKFPIAQKFELDAAYQKSIKALDKFDFWNTGPAVDYRPNKGLWLPQRRAVAFVHAYMAARNLLPLKQQKEAALIKMPTGTGKTAVIATLACASAITSRTLIITPRAALVQQLRRDLGHRFWQRLGAIYHEGRVREKLSEVELARLATEMDAGNLSPIRNLNANHYAEIYNEKGDPRQIIVSTFNALHLVLGIKPPAHRSMYGRESRPVAKSLQTLGRDEDELDEAELRRNETRFRQALKDVDLVIVDEGQHEPAYSWAQAVRPLAKPTVILTATPYRNDYKYFQVEGNYVFNLPWQEAVDKGLIRDVKFEGLTSAADTAARVRGKVTSYSEKAFVKDCATALNNLPTGKKVIVRAATYAALKRLQNAFWARGEAAVLIHHRFSGDEEKFPDLKTQAEKNAIGALRFQHVRKAEVSAAAARARIWMHESKLLEGIDRSEFVEVWLYDGFGTARELVQQVGRAIRRPDLADKHGKVATIRGSAKHLDKFEGAPTVAHTSSIRWTNYLAFEKYVQEKSESAFIAETQLLATLKRTAPGIQYIAGEFRWGHLLDEAPTMAAFKLPRRGTFCRVDKVLKHESSAIGAATLDTIEAAAMEAMELEERFDIQKVEAPVGQQFKHARLIRYLAWSNSPYLAYHHIPEWRLGLMAIVRAGRYLVLLDTEGVCLDTSRFGLLQPEPLEFQRLFPGGISGTTRIVETGAAGLDMNERGLRAITVRRHALEDAYFDIAESSQVPTSVSGFGPLNGRTARRRVSFLRSTIADSSSRPVALSQYITWAQAIGDALADEKIEGHEYFARFANKVAPLDSVQGIPKSILLDFWDLLDVSDETYAERHWDSTVARRILEKGNTCYEILSHEVNGEAEYYFEFEVAKDEVGNLDKYRVVIEYNYRATVPPGGRYKIHSTDLNNLLAIDEGQGDEEPGAFNKAQSPSLTRLVNQDQAYRIIPSAQGVVYANSHFYKPDIGDDVMAVLETATELANVISEKGDTRVTVAAEWSSRTLFGLVYGWWNGGTSRSPLAMDLRHSNVLICDDSNREKADFFAINDKERRVVIIHAKAGKGPANASAANLQDVARQAQASLAFAGSSRHAFDNPAGWAEDWNVTLEHAGNAVITRPRVQGKPAMAAAAAHAHLLKTLADPTYSKEIVVLTAGLLSKARAEQALTDQGQLDLQFIYYLASLRTSFDRAGVKLRVVVNV